MCWNHHLGIISISWDIRKIVEVFRDIRIFINRFRLSQIGTVKLGNVFVLILMRISRTILMLVIASMDTDGIMPSTSASLTKRPPTTEITSKILYNQQFSNFQ